MEPSNVVTAEDAAAALVHAGMAVDAALQTQHGQLMTDQGLHSMSMLFVARDYIRPLPEGLAEVFGPDLVTADLEELLHAIPLAPLDQQFDE